MSVMAEPVEWTHIDQALEEFVELHVDGWSHDEWLNLVSALRERGFDVEDEATVGLRLERMRLLAQLERLEIPGLGPKRREALADRFATWWRLQNATRDELREIRTLNRPLVERVIEGVR